MSSCNEFFFILEKHSRRKTTKKRKRLAESISKNKKLLTHIKQNGFGMAVQREYNVRFAFVKQSKVARHNTGLLFDGRFVGEEGKEMVFILRDGDLLLCITKKQFLKNYLLPSSQPTGYAKLKECLAHHFGQLPDAIEPRASTSENVLMYLSSLGLTDKVVVHLEVRPGHYGEFLRYWVATEDAIQRVENGEHVVELVAFTCPVSLELSFRSDSLECTAQTPSSSLHVSAGVENFQLPQYKANRRAAMTLKLTGLNLWYRLGLVDKRFVGMLGSYVPYHYGFLNLECDTGGVPRFITYTDFFGEKAVSKHWELSRGHSSESYVLNKKEIKFAREFFLFLFERQQAATKAKCKVLCQPLAHGLGAIGHEKRSKFSYALRGLEEVVLGLRVFIYVQSKFTMNWLRILAFDYKNSSFYNEDAPKKLFCQHFEKKFPAKQLLTITSDRQGEVLSLNCFTIKFENCRNFLATKPVSIGESHSNVEFYETDSLFAFAHELGCDCDEEEVAKVALSNSHSIQFDREPAFVPCKVSTTNIRLYCRRRGFQRCMHLLYLVTNINAYLWTNYDFDWITSNITSVGIVTQSCVTTAAFKNNKLYQSMEKLKPEMMEYFAKYTKGGIVETARKSLASGESIRPSFESFDPAVTLMELDIISSYASSTTQAQLPTGFCMAYFRRKQDDMLYRVDSCRTNHFEFKVYLYETKLFLDYLESVGGSMVSIYSAFGPFGLLSVAGSPVDIAYVYRTNNATKASLLLMNAHGAFVHGCPLCYDKRASYIGGKTLDEVIEKTKLRDEEIKAWVCRVGKSGLFESVAYTTRYSCHDYKEESLSNFVQNSTDPRIRRLIDAYPKTALIKPSDVTALACNMSRTGRGAGFVVGSASIPKWLRSKTFGAIPVKLTGRTLCLSHSTGEDLTLFTFESLFRLVLEHSLQLTYVEAVIFFSRDHDMSSIYEGLAKTRTDAKLSGQAAFQGYLKRALNHSVGTMGAKQKKGKVHSSLHSALLQVDKNKVRQRLYRVIGKTENNTMIIEQKKLNFISNKRTSNQLYFSNAPVPRYHAILEHSKLKLQQIFTFLDRNLLSTKFAYLKCNTDGLLIALSERCLVDCVIPWKQAAFTEEAKQLFDLDMQTSMAVWGTESAARPEGCFLGGYGRVKIEKCITVGGRVKQWSFFSPHSRFYAIKVEEDVEQPLPAFQHKCSGISVGSERAFEIAKTLVENENAIEKIEQEKTTGNSGQPVTQIYTFRHKKAWLERQPILYGDSLPLFV